MQRTAVFLIPSRTAGRPCTAARRRPRRHACRKRRQRRLLQGQREVLIRHGDECYRLRHTRNDKLILTK